MPNLSLSKQYHTDILIVLCYFADISTYEVYFVHGSNKLNTNYTKYWDIIKTQDILGPDLTKILHQRFCGIGKMS